MPEKSERLNLTVILEPGSGQAAARETMQRLQPQEWAMVVEYSLAILCLQESVATELEYWAAPRAAGNRER